MKLALLILVASAVIIRCTITGDIAPKYQCCECPSQLKATAKPPIKK